MALSFDSFDQQNAGLFAKLEELNGKVLALLSEVKSKENKVLALEFELKNIKAENDHLKKQKSKIQHQLQEQINRTKNIDFLSSQNFRIKDKIARLAEHTESQEVAEERRKDLIEALIAEIDSCVDQLKQYK